MTMRTPLKIHLMASLLTILACGGAIAKNTTTFNLPADHVFQAADFADDEQNGTFLGFEGLRGRPIKPIDGKYGIYLVRAPEGRFGGNPLKAGDVIVSVKERELPKEAVLEFKRQVSLADQSAGLLKIDRWRAGKTESIRIWSDKRNQPDLTNGGIHNSEAMSWTLGATGAHGWTWSIPHQTTEGSTQIYITEVEPGSPADGVLKVGDVVVGAFGEKFTWDARKEFADALTKAEKDGKLVLDLWNDGPSTELRAGKTRQATVPMEVMGTYSESTPFDCAKTERIIEEAVQHLKENGLGEKGIAALVNALGLLATGREDVMPIVSEHVQKVASDFPSDSTWVSGYSLVLMSEYHLVTGDKSVLSAISAYATHIARGQSQVGTWGHRICVPYQMSDGTLYGVAPGYGAMNQSGLTCLIGLALAQKCGVDDMDIRQAISRSKRFFEFCVDRGAITYGDHGASSNVRDDNGKCSQAAVFFDLIGDKEAATFLTKMTLASYNEREFGHTGNYYSFVWGNLGAARGGDEAASAFMKKMRWFYDLERGWQGDFFYQGKPGMAAKRNAENQYVDWDCTGARLLGYCLPRKALYITGKGRTIPAITGAELAEAVDAGELDDKDFLELSSKELLAKLTSWCPAVREGAAKALATKPENVVQQLIAMLDSDNRYARYGAIQGLQYAGRASKEAAEAILAKVQASDDMTLKFFAVHAFSSLDKDMGLAEYGQLAAPVFMRMIQDGQFDDPTGNLLAQLSRAFFYSGNASQYLAIARKGEGIENLDSELLIGTSRKLLKNNNGAARSNVAVIYNKLTDEQLKLMWKDIYQATRDLAPSGIMFASGVRLAGINLMAKHHAREGMETAVWYLTNQKLHDGRERTTHVLKVLVEQYAGHAKAVLPELGKAAEYYEPGGLAAPLPGHESEIALAIRAAIEQIKTAPTPEWELTSIAEYLK